MSEQKEKRKKRSIKKRWSTKKKIIVSTIIIFGLLISILATGYLYIRSKIYSGLNPTETISETEYKEVDGITNVLLIGTDARTLDESARADSIIIATLDNNNKKIKLTSLFRDTLVNIPGYGEGKLNAALAYGGAELLIETIRNTYGINLDKYIIINFSGFEAIIDEMGGLELNVEEYMLEELNKYIGESTGGNDCPVTEAGLQVLNGKQALSYARIRKGVGDEYARTDRQREVLIKVAEKLKETKPSKYLGIMNNMLEYIKTNIEPLQALNMAYTIYKFPSLEIEQLQMPITELAEGRLYKNLGWVFLMDVEQNAQILNDFIFEDKITDASEYDYDSFNQAMADYKLEEEDYNSKYNINPEDYSDNSEDVTEPSTSNDNSDETNNSGGNDNTTNNSNTNNSNSNSNSNSNTTNNNNSNNSNNSSNNNDSEDEGVTNTPTTDSPENNGEEENNNSTEQETTDQDTSETTPPTTENSQEETTP